MTAVTFECPNCRGPLEITGNEKTIICRFCGSKVIVPKELRDEAVADAGAGSSRIVIDMGRPTDLYSSSQTVYKSGGGAGWLVALIVGSTICLIVGIIVLSVAPLGMTFAFLRGIPVLGGLAPEPLVGFASPGLTFGGEGTGPGLFTDARHVAVDGQGNITVGEYQDGRVQRFDAEGNFLSLFMVDSSTPLSGLTVDRQGVVYAVHGGDIHRYDGETGAPLGTLPYDEGWGFDSIAMTADGGLVASWYRNRDDIVRFDSSGNVTLVIREAISGQSGRSELGTHVAVDGLGNIYALGTFNNGVFKFSPEGRFLTRFGGGGDDPGQFRAPQAIAVDGQGRVYVMDVKGVQVFDSEGRYLDVIPIRGTTYGMTISPQNELFVVTGKEVIKYTLNK